MNTATREMVDAVRQALLRADSDGDGTPDYDVLAEAAVQAVLEMQVKQMFGSVFSDGDLKLASRGNFLRFSAGKWR